MRSFLIVLAGCGRLGFDPRAVGGDDGGVVVGDGTIPSLCSMTAEVCNGLDDDCNGLVDEGCPCMPVAMSINETPAAHTTELLWTGAGYLQTTGNAAAVGLFPITTSGNLGAFVQVYNGAVGSTGGASSMAWSGSMLEVAYDHDMGPVEAMHYDPSTLVHASVRLDATYPGASPRVAWAGDHFVVAWIALAGGFITRDLSPSGALAGVEQLRVPALVGVVDDLQVTPTGAIACVRSSGATTIVSIDAAGAAQTRPAALGSGSDCRLLAIPNGFLAWLARPNTPTPVPLVFLTTDGTTAGSTMLHDPTPYAYYDVAIQRVATGFWVLATHTTDALYGHAIDELHLDFAGHATAGPVELVAPFQANLWSSPRAVATGSVQTWTWAQAYATLTFTQACP